MQLHSCVYVCMYMLYCILNLLISHFTLAVSKQYIHTHMHIHKHICSCMYVYYRLQCLTTWKLHIKISLQCLLYYRVCLILFINILRIHIYTVHTSTSEFNRRQKSFSLCCALCDILECRNSPSICHIWLLIMSFSVQYAH